MLRVVGERAGLKRINKTSWNYSFRDTKQKSYTNKQQTSA